MSPQEELAKYFEVCGYEPTDLISIGTRAGAEGDLHFAVTTVADAPRQISARSKVNCWFGANPIRELPPRKPGESTRGTAADVVAVRALWADIDIKGGGMPDQRSAKGVMQELASLLGVRPVAIVRSGHGFQPRWKLATTASPAELAPVIERFGRLVQLVAARLGGKADPVYDLARIIRAPHTMNLKPGLEPVETGVWLYDHGQELSLERLVEVLDEYVPLSATPQGSTGEAENRHVGLERGNAYVKGAIEAIERELKEIAEWPTGKTDERGRGWEKIQADAAFRLASLAKASWNSLELEEAKNLFIIACPKDGHWTVRDVIKKWNAQVKRATAADAPADITDDPLAGGASPLRSTGRAAGDDRPAGQTRGERGVPTGAADQRGAAGGDPGRGAPHREAGAATGPERPGDVDPGLARPEAAEGDDRVRVGNWRQYGWHDSGNAERLIARFGDRLRHVPPMKRWLWYEDGAWRETETGGERAAHKLFDELYQLEGPLYSEVKYRKGNSETSERIEFAKWVQDQKSAARMKAAAQVLKFSGHLDASPAEFDAEPMLLNAPNGIVDLFSGELLEHDPERKLRRQIPVKYDPEAKARRWEAFLERVMPSPDMRDYLQRIIGYSITGRTSEQVVFFHVGPPASGKSVFLRIMEAVLGDFSRVVPPSTLLNKKMEQHPTDVMGMEGRRMLQVSETPEGARLDEALVKRLSGEETITARGMGENFRDFRIVGKVHLVTNHDPGLSDDPAVARRVHYVPWTVSIPEDERDPMLAETIIREELQGVLAWAVRGTKRWTEDRLARPAEAAMARARYLASEDEFGQFIDEELILGAETFTPFKDVFRRYLHWCEGLRVKPMSYKAFSRKMQNRGIETARTNSTRGFKVALQAPRWIQDPLG